MPRQLVIEMVYAANYCLNMFPRPGGMSKTLSPRTLLTGQSWSYTTHCKLEFDNYVQTHKEHDNSMATRTIGAIALRPTGNTQGGYFFFSLSTGRVLNRGRWTSLPMPNEVIDRVHRMAQQEHGNNGLLFEDRNHNQLIDPDDDGEDDSTYHPKEDEEDEDNNDNDDNDDGNGGEDANPQAIHNNPLDNHDEHAGGVHDDDEVEDDARIDNNAQHAEPDIIQEENNEGTGGFDQDEADSTSVQYEPVDHNETEDTMDNCEPVALDDPTLPPRARWELKRLANDGVGPTIYQGRTRSQTQHSEQSMTTNGKLEASTPLPYRQMTAFEKELFH